LEIFVERHMGDENYAFGKERIEDFFERQVKDENN